MALRRFTAMLAGGLVLASLTLPAPLLANSLGWRDDRADIALIGVRADIIRPVEVRIEATAISGAPGFVPGGGHPTQIVIRGNPYVVTVTVDSAVSMHSTRPSQEGESQEMDMVDIRPLVIIRRKGPAPIAPSLVPQGDSDTVVFTFASLSPGVVDGVNTVSAHFQ